MRLKSLELFGFKSFVDQTTIHFEEGVTGVVGPNGCGKSNIVDAIRWAMGEQSAKHLRGSDMQDVIFNGSQVRAPLNMAQVTLTFDLTDGRAPAGYTDYTEVQIERRLYRSGESEYYINKVPCRLRDIVDFFLGTGVGTKAYSIIEQGRIGHILSSKPEERRLIIEEAAGISKFKNRKESALRKIESTEANLSRLNDIIGEIRRQLNALDRQARKAEKYKIIYDDLKGRELTFSSIRYHQLYSQVEKLEAEASDLTQNEAVLAANLSQFEADSERERLVLAQVEQELGHVQEKFYMQQNAVKLHENAIEYQASKLKDLERQAENCALDIEDFRAKLKKCEDQMEVLNQSKLTVDLSVASANEKIVQLEEVLQQAMQICVEWQSKTEETNKEILKCVSLVAESQSRLEYLERRHLETEGRIAKGQTEVDGIDRARKEVDKKIAGSDRDLEELKQLSFRLTDEKTIVKQDLEEKRTLLETSLKNMEGLKNQLSAKQSMLVSLEEIHQNMEGYREGVRTVLKASGENLTGICGPVSQIVDTEPRFEAAVSAALGEKMQYVVVQSQEEGLNAVEFLRTQAKGRSTFVPLNIRAASKNEQAVEGPGVMGPLLDNVRFSDDYKQIAQYLFGDCVLVEDLKQALNIWQNGAPDKTLVTLQGEVIDRTGVISGGAGLEGEALLGYKRRTEEMHNDIAASKALTTESEKEVLRLKSLVQALEERVEALSRDSHGEEIRLVHQEKDGLRMREELGRYNQDRDRITMEIARCLDEKREIEQEKEKVILLLEEQISTQQILEKDMAEFQAKLGMANGDKDRCSQDLAQGRAQLTQTEDKALSIEREMEQQVTAKLEWVESIEKRLVEINRGQELSKELAAAQVTEREQLEKALVEMDTLGQKQKELKEQYETLSKQVKEKELSLREIRRRHEEMVKSLHTNDLKLAEGRRELKILVDQMLERYKIDITHYTAESVVTPDFNFEAEQAILFDLKDRLEKLGSVHVGAIEEYDELKSRYEFLSKQQADLVSSLESLKKAIHKINRVSRERFIKTFEMVNEKFQEIFPRLFKGGRARLMLIDEENLLDSGVEIYAQPPGKKLQAITLLSGGEKALTAVALVFSIFLIKPSPFCLLDEVDAPLDEANIDRFNEMVREMTAHSQFIMITHNRRTMEKTDCLYGVTMEEAGISKVVSVRLNGVATEPIPQVA
ncbi:MAG: chromosome segregation protein SMC [Deltaproteobacteria bacterium]|nr:chromosome segregation protein SMC [Deltaproteobacteria bacterium]